MLSEGFGHAEDDMAARACARRRSTPSGCSPRSASALAADGDLLGRDERAAIDAAAGDAARGARAAATAARSSAASKRSPTRTEDFAAERMNRGIRRALAGRRIEDV